jgi:hypothetical protein
MAMLLNSDSFQPSNLEHLCINLSAETMQHFYNTHIFKACLESCRDEGVSCDWEVDYLDNVPCIDLISSLVGPDFCFIFLGSVQMEFHMKILKH